MMRCPRCNQIVATVVGATCICGLMFSADLCGENTKSGPCGEIAKVYDQPHTHDKQRVPEPARLTVEAISTSTSSASSSAALIKPATLIRPVT
jgi:hypothetical protein